MLPRDRAETDRVRLLLAQERVAGNRHGPPGGRRLEMNADQVAERARILEGLVTFVTRSFMVEASAIDLDRSLIDQGIIDSFGLMEITTFIENAFGAKIQEQDMTREAFGSVNKMATFVCRRKSGEI
jgi:acyl carrier protein